MIKTFDLFSVSMFGTHIPEGFPDLEVVKNYKFIPAGGHGSRNTYMSENMSVLDDFPQEKQTILNKFNEVKNEYLGHTDTDFVITRSWVTKTEKNSDSYYHKHTNSYFSGVFYFDGCTEDSGPIEFENPLNSFSSFSMYVGTTNAYTSKNRSVKAGKNTLIFFPSFVSHRIGLHLSDTPRYSLAFNLHPIGEYGRGDSAVNIITIK
jgi:uncharacterized protein (TIGR02466 family)